MSDWTGAYGRSAARLSTRLASGGAADKAWPMSKAERQREERQRAERLAAALRDNLRRRKTQSRAAEPDPQTKDENQAASE